MIVIAARPAVGKSTLALDFARAAAIHHNMATVFFSLEMGKNEIAMRLLSAEATIALQDLRKGTIRDDQWSKIAATVGRLNEAPDVEPAFPPPDDVQAARRNMATAHVAMSNTICMPRCAIYVRSPRILFPARL